MQSSETHTISSVDEQLRGPVGDTATIEPLPPEFYERSTLVVARDLLGCLLISDSPEGRTVGRIVETEGYVASIDPACHAYRGRTRRNEPMWGEPGRAYVYFTYGMHHCLNFVTEPEGTAAAVLIRAVEPVAGLDLMERRRGQNKPKLLCSGPGRLCQAMGIRVDLSGAPLQGPDLWVLPGEDIGEVVTTTRIGVTLGSNFPWRFYPKGSPWISKR